MMFIFLRTGLTYVEKETRKGGKALYSSHGFAYNYVKKLENGSLQYKCQLQHRDKSAGCSGTLTVTCDGEVTDRVQHSEQCRRHFQGVVNHCKDAFAFLSSVATILIPL